MSDTNNFDLDPNTNNLETPMETTETLTKTPISIETVSIQLSDDDINAIEALKDDKLNLAKDLEENLIEIKADKWTADFAWDLFNLRTFAAKGYKMTDDSLWSFSQTALVSHVVLNKVMIRFNADFTDVIEGTRSRSMAQNANASDTWDKLPLGEDNHSPKVTGNGVVIGFNADGSLNRDGAIVSNDFSYAEKDRKLMFGAEDVLAGICGDDEYTYSAEDIALATKIVNKEVNYKSLGKAVAGPFLTMTKWFEMKINTSFSFDQKDFDIKNVKQEVDNVISVNQYIRACVVKQLAKIAKEVGVAPEQYCEFIFAGLSHSSKVKKSERYKEPSLFANFTFNRETNLPAGLVVMCQPVGFSSYKTSTKLNAPKGRAARLGLKAPAVEVPAFDWSTHKPAATPITKVDMEFEGFNAISSSSSNVDAYDWENIQNASAPAPAPAPSTQDDDEDEDKYATGN